MSRACLPPQVFGLRREQMWSGWNWCLEPSKAGSSRTLPQGGLRASSSPLPGTCWSLPGGPVASCCPPGLTGRPGIVLRPLRQLPNPGCGRPGIGTDTPEAGLRPPCTGTSFFLKDSEPGLPVGLFSESTPKPEPSSVRSTACSVEKRAWVLAQLQGALDGDSALHQLTSPSHPGDPRFPKRVTCGSSTRTELGREGWPQGPRSGRASRRGPAAGRQ